MSHGQVVTGTISWDLGRCALHPSAESIRTAAVGSRTSLGIGVVCKMMLRIPMGSSSVYE